MASATSYSQKKARKRLRSGAPREESTFKVDINVTPLVDVVLVLLIIFMVVTPMISGGVQVALPRTAHHGKKPDDGKDIIVSVTKSKHIYISHHQVPKKDVEKVVKEELRKFPEKGIYLKGDSMTPYGAVLDVMESINKLGVEDIMLGTDEIKTKLAD